MCENMTGWGMIVGFDSLVNWHDLKKSGEDSVVGYYDHDGRAPADENDS